MMHFLFGLFLTLSKDYHIFTLLSKIRDCFPRIKSGVAMTNPRLVALFVIARSFFATKQSGFGYRCNYNGLLAILDTTDIFNKFLRVLHLYLGKIFFSFR
jgi:hypothetical protein